jgi:hypothetical protein
VIYRWATRGTHRARLTGISPTGILRWGWRSCRVSAALSRLKPYAFHVALAAYIPALLYADIQTQTLTQQHLLGVLTFAFLFLALRFSPPSERRRVWLLVLIATGLELFSSGVWGVYAYRFGNVPLYVPPGHGLIYLFALRSARAPLMANRGKTAGLAALAFATLWAAGGFTLGPLLFGRLDASAVLLWPIFAFFMWKSSSTGVYAAAFFVTSALELLGTAFGNWTWAAAVPVLQLALGNPPSVIAGAYCCLDFTASRAARLFPVEGRPSRAKKPKQGISDAAKTRLLASGGNEA